MDNDDEMVGRLLSRREVMALFGAAGAAFLAGCGDSAATSATATGIPAAATPGANAPAATSVSAATSVAGGATAVPSCVVSPALTEGPYFVDAQLNRSDIRSDPTSGEARQGVPFDLTINVRQVSAAACTALAGALVDIWHCDAEGNYSNVADQTVGFNTVGQQWLRGQQTSDASGMVTFTTIFPGWYPGRAVHIHFKVRTAANASQSYEFTSQFFFDPAAAQAIYANPPYAAKGQPDTPNSSDGIYQGGGDQLLVPVAKAGDGYAGVFDIGIDLSAPQSQQGGPGGPPATP